MQIRCLSVCVGYSDILNVSLTFNKCLFEDLIIVTCKDDIQTQAVCDYHRIRYITTESFWDNDSSFNKANGINCALENLYLENDSWILHLDADIVLPANFRRLIKEEYLQQDAIYGVDRKDIVSKQNISELIFQHKSQINYYTFLDLEQVYGSNYSPRIFNIDKGYSVIGYFQLFHSKHKLKYPNTHTNAARSDMQFSDLFLKNKQLLFPGIIAYHLMTENSEMGINWSGRQSISLNGIPQFYRKPDVSVKIKEITSEQFDKVVSVFEIKEKQQLPEIFITKEIRNYYE